MDNSIKKLSLLMQYDPFCAKILLYIADYANITVFIKNDKGVPKPVEEGLKELLHQIKLLHLSDFSDTSSYLYDFCREYKVELMRHLYNYHDEVGKAYFVGRKYFKGCLLTYLVSLIHTVILEYVLDEIERANNPQRQNTKTKITPKELRYALEYLLDSNIIKLFESFAILDGLPLYNYDIEKNNGYIIANHNNFKKFTKLLTKLYHEGTYYNIKSVVLYELHQKHINTIEDMIYQLCEDKRYNYFYIGKAVLTDTLGSTMASKAIDLLLDKIVDELASVSKEELQKIDKGNIKWDTKHM